MPCKCIEGVLGNLWQIAFRLLQPGPTEVVNNENTGEFWNHLRL
jgi:hypothetical protein